ncbi:MAG: hypothetical protein ACLGIP_12050, partial [Alphaproteobacteria bacterium]
RSRGGACRALIPRGDSSSDGKLSGEAFFEKDVFKHNLIAQIATYQITTQLDRKASKAYVQVNRRQS